MYVHEEIKNNIKNSKGLTDGMCQICGKYFKGPNYLKRHISTVHERKKDFKCDICDKGFTEKKSLKQHISTQHEGKRPFKCELCKKSFTVKRTLMEHVSVIHEGKRPFKCHKCSKAFVSKQKMKFHIDKAHGGASEEVKFKKEIKEEWPMTRPLSSHLSDAANFPCNTQTLENDEA